MDAQSAYIGMVAALSGVVIQWLTENVTKFFAGRHRASCNLRENAFVALDRLSKINDTHRRRARKQLDNEIYLLGADLDRWRDCIAKAPGKNGRHWQLYKRLRDEVLLRHDLTSTKSLVEQLESISGVR